MYVMYVMYVPKRLSPSVYLYVCTQTTLAP
jgi:hypothetical protein